MRRENCKILILCADGQMLDLIAKAICSKFPESKLSFSNNIEECVAKNEQNCPDIVVAIPKEPVWDVCNLIHRLKLSNYGCRILMASQYSSGQIVSDYMSEGVSDIIAMPINIDLLIKKITVMINGQSGYQN